MHNSVPILVLDILSVDILSDKLAHIIVRRYNFLLFFGILTLASFID